MKLSALTRTRRGRAMLAAVPTVAVIGVLMGGVAQGAVPVSMAISGQQFKIAADKLDGTGFVGRQALDTLLVRTDVEAALDACVKA